MTKKTPKRELAKAERLASEGRQTEAEAIFAKAISVESDPEALYRYGHFLLEAGRLTQAEIMFNRVLASSVATNEDWIAKARNNLGVIYQTRGDLRRAEVMHLGALEIERELGNDKEISLAYSNLGIIYQKRGDLDQAESMYQEALQLEEQIGHEDGIATACGNLGIIYRKRGNLEAAEEMHLRSAAIEKELGRKEDLAIDYSNLGLIYQTRGDLEDAKTMFSKALELNEQLGRSEGVASAVSNLGLTHQLAHDFDAAEEFHLRALDLNERIGRRKGLAITYANLADLYEAKGDSEAAQEHSLRSQRLVNSIGAAVRIKQGDRVDSTEMERRRDTGIANPEHLKILKQGVEVWNSWRNDYPDINPELSNAALEGADLRQAVFANANLQGANLSDADLRRTSFKGANLRNATLEAAKLHEADLGEAHLQDSNLKGAKLRGAGLWGTDLWGADFRKASLLGANLGRANFTGTKLERADLNGSQFYETILADVDLGRVQGLESVAHLGPSIIDSRTLVKSQGQIALNFLRGCGLADWEIQIARLYAPNLPQEKIAEINYEIMRLKSESPIQVNPLFISYSNGDEAFVDTLEAFLGEKRIRYWRDVHGLKAGRMEVQIERAIRFNPTVLLVLSKNSVESDWVRWEAAKAREMEKELGRDVLCPVTLDDAWKTCDWPGSLRRQIEDYHILDFSEWQDSEAFGHQFRKLIDGLGLFYPRATIE